MKPWITILKGFGYVWLVLATLFIIFCTFGVWMKKGFVGVQELFSPFNVINYISVVITLAPGLGALALANKLKNKAQP